MDSNKKSRVERIRTPVHLNTTDYHFKSGAPKRWSPNLSRRPNLNETIINRTGAPSGSDPKIKSKLTTAYAVNYETECDIAYNDYLQALLKQQIVKKTISEHREILDGQILVQNENLYKRNKNLQEIEKETELFEKQRELVEAMGFLQGNLDDLKNAYTAYDTRNVLSCLKEVLNSRCNLVTLRHIKNFESQYDYDRFMENLQHCRTTMEKIYNSGRDFEKVHVLAEEIRRFFKLKEDVNKIQQDVLKLEKTATYSFLKNTSDYFAIQYSGEDT